MKQQLVGATKESGPILVIINSNGGTLNDSIAICNMLRSVPNKVITVAMGMCASAATMIFACGKKRYIYKDTQYMLHQPLMMSGYGYQNKSDVEKIHIELDSALKIYKKYVLKGTKIPKEKLDIAFVNGDDLNLDHNQCLEYKIATDLFTTQKEFYEKEKIDIEQETIMLYDVMLPNEAGEV